MKSIKAEEEQVRAHPKSSQCEGARQRTKEWRRPRDTCTRCLHLRRALNTQCNIHYSCEVSCQTFGSVIEAISSWNAVKGRQMHGAENMVVPFLQQVAAQLVGWLRKVTCLNQRLWLVTTMNRGCTIDCRILIKNSSKSNSKDLKWNKAWERESKVCMWIAKWNKRKCNLTSGQWSWKRFMPSHSCQIDWSPLTLFLTLMLGAWELYNIESLTSSFQICFSFPDIMILSCPKCHPWMKILLLGPYSAHNMR